MKLLIVGDPHISHKRLHRSQEFLLELADIINDVNIDATIILGDVFDEHEWVHVTCSTMWKNFLDKTDKTKKIIHLLGNHEMVNANDYPSQFHALHAHNQHEHYVVVDKPTEINGMGFVPYTPSGKFADAMSGISAPLVFCHQEFIGSVSEQNGDMPPQNCQVISGHIHQAMKLNNIWYPGSPLQHSFGEEDEKFIYIIDVQGKEYRLVQKIQLQLKAFQTVFINWNDTEIPADINTDAAYYRFVTTAKRTEIAIFKSNELYKKLLNIGKVKLNVLPEERVEKRRDGVTFRAALAELLKNEDLKEIADEIGA